MGVDIGGCPGGTFPCGRGCLIDSAKCCNADLTDDNLGTFECPGSAVANCTLNDASPSCGGSRYCCSGSGSQNFGSLDCTNGTVVCNQNCVSAGTMCCSLTNPDDCDPVPTPAGSGGSSGSASGSSSGGITSCGPYDAASSSGFQYTGVFSYSWIDTTKNPPPQGQGSFTVSFDVSCLATAAGGSSLTITSVTASDPYFGTNGATVTAAEGSLMVMPANPPTTASNSAQPGQGVTILFPSGAALVTTATTTGDLSVVGSSPPLTIRSNGSAPTWSVTNSTTSAAPYEPPNESTATVTATSWTLSQH